MKNGCFFLVLLFCLGCTRQSGKINIVVSLADSNRTLKVSGFDRAVIAEIGRDSANAAWQSLIPVYKMPADTDMKDFQAAQPGNYRIQDSVVVFTPDTPFMKGQLYFVRFFQFEKGRDAMDYITHKGRPGALHFNDLIFKY